MLTLVLILIKHRNKDLTDVFSYFALLAVSNKDDFLLVNGPRAKIWPLVLNGTGLQIPLPSI